MDVDEQTNRQERPEPQEERIGDFTNEVAYELRNRLASMAEGWQEQTGLEVSVVPTTNVQIEISHSDCIQYDIDPSWIGEIGTFSNLAIFDGFYNVDSESFIEIEFMSAVRLVYDEDIGEEVAQAVIGVRDNSSHCEYVKKGLTIELNGYDIHMGVPDHLFDEFSLELVHLETEDGDLEERLDNMMAFQMEVLKGASMLLVFRYFEEYNQLEASR
uniref:Uncharacterized protein n=1 Tax=viral metagenome TaxID=1070528 RepID=A0A2V0R965_9ZZZZ